MKYPWQIICAYYTWNSGLDESPYYMCRLPGFWFPYSYTPGTFNTISGISTYWLDAPWCRV